MTLLSLESVIWLVLFAYGLQALFFLAGLRKLRDARTETLRSVSVIVAARNEERTIGPCIDSICRQTMSPSQYEVLVVDDESTDGTAEIVRQRAVQYANLRFLSVQKDPNLRGKSRPLAAGIDAAQGEIILITDADCTVPTTWVEHTARRYADGVGLVGGMTLQRSDDGFGGMQSIDWAYLLGIAASGVAWGVSFGSIGNNLSFRKQAYLDVGGYRALPFSVTEDYTLVAAILRTRSWKHVYPIDPAVLVESAPCHSIPSLVKQKHRWGRGGLDVHPIGFLIMAVSWLLHVLPFVYLVGWGAWGHTLTVLFLKSVFDYTFVNAVLSRLNRRHELLYFPAFEVYYSAYVVALPLLVFLGGRVDWKGRTY